METAARAHRLTWADYGIAVALGLAFVVALMSTMGLGYVRDEGFYFKASESYEGWFEELEANVRAGEPGRSFEQASVDRYFAANHEHPALPKMLFALSHIVLHERLGWMSPATSKRFPATLFAGALIALVYLFGAEAFGRRVGVLAALMTALMPRPWFHAHLACFDYPVNTMWFAISYAYWKSLRSTGWGWATGVLFGIGLAVKHNIFFLPVVLVLHWLVVARRGFALSREEGQWRLRLPPVPIAFLAMALLGGVIWYALWPWQWFDTYNRTAWYFNFHLHHVHYFQYYFGQNLYAPPFPVEFPFVMSAVTMPELVVVGWVPGAALLVQQWLRAGRAATGLRAACARRWGALAADPRGTGLWLALGAFVPFAIIAMPSTPIFGGIKHWMPAMPFVSVLAALAVVEGGRGLGDLVGRLVDRAWVRQGASALLAALVMAPAVWACVHSHGYGTAFYNSVLGGTRGAADHKMMRQFWGYSSVHALGFLNANVGPGRPVFFQNTAFDAYQMYQRMGQLRTDIPYGRMPTSDYGLIHHQMAARSLEIEIWRTYNTRNPAFVADYDGVPVLSVYPNTHQLRRDATRPNPPTRRGR